MNFRKFLYFPHILIKSEKRLFLLLFFVVILTGGGFLVRVYFQLTKPVPDTGGSYTEGILKEPRAINPIYISNDADRDISRLIFSGLITYSAEGKIIFDLAQNYETKEDGKVYIVMLKENAFWHDGKPVTADDVIFTIKTIQNPFYKSPLKANWQGVTAEKVDQKTVRFTLHTPYALFIENLTTGIIPKHLWESITPEQAPLHELNLKPVGSGPYKFNSLNQAKDGSILEYTLQRNKKYHHEGPYLNKITFLFFKTDTEMVNSWRKGKIDGFGPASKNLIPKLDQDKFKFLAARMPRIFGVFFNEKKAVILKDKKVREALAHAINKQMLTEKLTSGGAIPTDYPLPLFASDPPKDSPLSYNPEKAKKLLTEAGWKDENNDGVLEKKSRRGKIEETTELRLQLTTSDWPDLLQTAETIKEMLKNVGVEITVKTMPFLELESNVIRPRDFEMLLFGQVYGYEPDPFAFWHSSQIKDPGLNVAMYANKDADKIMEETRKTFDLTTRRKKYEELQKIINNDLPAVFLYSQLYLYLLPTDIKGVEIKNISLPADRFSEINNWYKKTKRVFK